MSWVCHPIIEFTTAQNTTHQFRSNRPVNFSKCEIGTPVKVRYLPGNPKRAHIDTFETNWLLPIFLMILSLPLISYRQTLFFAEEDAAVALLLLGLGGVAVYLIRRKRT